MLSSKAQIFINILPYIQKHCIKRKLEAFRIEGYNVQENTMGIWSDVSVRSIDLWEKEKIPFPEHYWTKYFKLVNSVYSNYYGTPVKEYVLRTEYVRCFQSKIEPHMIYEIPIIDPSLESQQHILNNRMKQNDYWKYIYGNTDDGYHYEGYEMKQKELLEEFYKEIRNELK
jgi:hypothetical protein